MLFLQNINQISAAADKKRRDTADYLLRNMQYAPVMRFILDRVSYEYAVERRCYRGDEQWMALGFGPIGKMASRYIRHIGRESFFDLM